MPRIPLSSVLLALLFAGSPALASTAVPDVVHGQAHVTAFTLMSHGQSRDLQDGLHSYQMVCTDCYIRLRIDGDGLAFRRGLNEINMTAGTWEIRDFAGSVAYDRHGLGDFTFTIDGVGFVREIVT